MELFLDEIKEVVSEDDRTSVFENFYVGKAHIRLAVVHPDGVFIVMDELHSVNKEEKNIFDDISRKFKEKTKSKAVQEVTPSSMDDVIQSLYLPKDNYFFTVGQDFVYFHDDEEGDMRIDDLYISFINLFCAALSGRVRKVYHTSLKEYIWTDELMEFEEKEHTDFVSHRQLELVKERITQCQENPSRGLLKSHSKYRTVNGQQYIRSTDRLGREVYCPVDTTYDSDGEYKYALFGGWFGLHKFRERRIFMGILYLITCGIFGIGWIVDLLMMNIGKYKLKSKWYAPKTTNQRFCWMALAIAVLAAVGMVFLWSQLFGVVMDAVTKFLSEVLAPAIADNIQNQIS